MHKQHTAYLDRHIAHMVYKSLHTGSSVSLALFAVSGWTNQQACFPTFVPKLWATQLTWKCFVSAGMDLRALNVDTFIIFYLVRYTYICIVNDMYFIWSWIMIAAFKKKTRAFLSIPTISTNSGQLSSAQTWHLKPILFWEDSLVPGKH